MPILKSIFTFFVDTLETIVVALCVFVILYLFLIQPHQVYGNSMLPNFHDQEYILTDKISYRVRQPLRGEVIVFKAPEDTDKDFIKRIIGLPSERVKIANGKIFVDGKLLSEPYLDPDLRTPGGKFIPDGTEVTVPSDEYIVFGDNRLNSSDSRTWGFLPKKNIIGKALFVYWPISQVGLVPKVSYE